MRALVWLSLFAVLLSCNKSTDFLSEFTFKNSKGKETSIHLKKNCKGVVFVFLLPDCPFSQFYTMAVNQVHSVFSAKGYEFYGIVPGNLYSLVEIDSFKSQHHFIPEILVDHHSKMTKQMKVTIVPEVIFTDNQGKVLYRGKIDDQAVEPGQKKFIPTKFYLLEALKNHNSKKPVAIKRTKPVGCFIE